MTTFPLNTSNNNDELILLWSNNNNNNDDGNVEIELAKSDDVNDEDFNQDNSTTTSSQSSSGGIFIREWIEEDSIGHLLRNTGITHEMKTFLMKILLMNRSNKCKDWGMDWGTDRGMDWRTELMELRNTRITPYIKIKLLQFFHRDERRYLPRLRDTFITDRGAQAIMDIIASSSNKKRDWFHFYVPNTCTGDVGVEALARAFVATDANKPLLYLSDQRTIDDDAAISIAEALLENPSWSELSLWGSEIGKEGLQALASALHGNTNWERLFLRETKIGDEGAKVLASALEQNKKWKELHLQGVKFDMEGVCALADALAINPSWSKLNLSGSKIGARGILALANAMLNNRQWESLVLYGTKIGDEGAIALAEALQQNNGWRVLDLHKANIGLDGPKSLANALQTNTHWEYLIINVGSMRDGFIKMLADQLAKTKDWKRFVIHLSLPWYDDDEEPVWSQLAQAIAQRQQPGKWKSLVLWFPGYNINVMKALAQNLWKRHPNTNPNIPNLFVTNENAENAMKMANYLGQCWQEMDIFLYDVKGIYAKENNAIVQVTHDVNFGRTMSFHHTQLTYQGAIMLAQALSPCDSCIYMSLSYSQIGDQGAEALARAFTSIVNAGWQCFDLSNTEISDDGARHIGNALNGNNNWRILRLVSTPIK